MVGVFGKSPDAATRLAAVRWEDGRLLFQTWIEKVYAPWARQLRQRNT